MILFSNISFSYGEPILKDPLLRVEKIVEGLEYPTMMDFVDEGILVLQKNDGKVFFIKDGVFQENPVLDVEVTSNGERGLLGITVLDSFVYLYFTESDVDGGEPIANRIYKYNWDGEKLSNPVLILELPGENKVHNGGVLINDGEDTIFAVIGDQGRKGKLQNMGRGEYDDTGVIFEIDVNNPVVKPSKTISPSDHYYGIGIRNSYGLAIDPVTGNLWNTENGPSDWDEINLVNPNFNSGWRKIQGPATESEIAKLPIDWKFKYSEPEFSWERPIGITSIVFPTSVQFEEYNDTVLVSSANFQTIYVFKLNEERTGFVFSDSALKDLVANSEDSLDDNIFGSGFNIVTDMKIGQDGLLYVVSLVDGVIYRISPTEESEGQLKKLIPDCSSPAQPQVNWAGCDFSNSEIINADLKFANLTNTKFKGATLKNSDFSHAILIGADMSDSNLDYADLSHANLAGADVSGSTLVNAKLLQTQLEDSNFVNSDFTNANLNGAKFIRTNLNGANFFKADLKNAVLINASFQKTNLNQTNFFGAYIENVKWDDSTFFETNIPSCNGSFFWFKVWRFVVTEVQYYDFFLLYPLEWIAQSACGPHHYVEPNIHRESFNPLDFISKQFGG